MNTPPPPSFSLNLSPSVLRFDKDQKTGDFVLSGREAVGVVALFEAHQAPHKILQTVYGNQPYKVAVKATDLAALEKAMKADGHTPYEYQTTPNDKIAFVVSKTISVEKISNGLCITGNTFAIRAMMAVLDDNRTSFGTKGPIPYTAVRNADGRSEILLNQFAASRALHAWGEFGGLMEKAGVWKIETLPVEPKTNFLTQASNDDEFKGLRLHSYELAMGDRIQAVLKAKGIKCEELNRDDDAKRQIRVSGLEAGRQAFKALVECGIMHPESDAVRKQAPKLDVGYIAPKAEAPKEAPQKEEPKKAEPESTKSAADAVSLFNGALTVERTFNGGLRFSGTKEGMNWLDVKLLQAKNIRYTRSESEITIEDRREAAKMAAALQTHLEPSDYLNLGALVLYSTSKATGSTPPAGVRRVSGGPS